MAFASSYRGTAILIAKAVGAFTARQFNMLVLLAIGAVLLEAQTDLTLDEEQRLAQAAMLTRQHRFTDAEAKLKGISIPPDPKRAIAFYRLRAAIDAGLQRPKESADEM